MGQKSATEREGKGEKNETEGGRENTPLRVGTVEIMLLLAAGDDVAAGAESLKAGWFWNLGMCG